MEKTVQLDKLVARTLGIFFVAVFATGGGAGHLPTASAHVFLREGRDNSRFPDAGGQ